MKRKTKGALFKLAVLVLCLMVTTSQIGFGVGALGTAAYASMSANSHESRQNENDEFVRLSESEDDVVTVPRWVLFSGL